MNFIRRWSVAISAVVLAAMFAGCAETQEGRTTQAQGAGLGALMGAALGAGLGAAAGGGRGAAIGAATGAAIGGATGAGSVKVPGVDVVFDAVSGAGAGVGFPGFVTRGLAADFAGASSTGRLGFAFGATEGVSTTGGGATTGAFS